MLIAAAPPPEPWAGLRSRLTGFAGFLRANGFGVGAGDAPRVLDVGIRAGILEPRVLRWSLKALLCGRADEWRRFDRLFDAYFLPPNRAAFAPPPQAPVDEAVAEAGRGTRASRNASLASADFAALHRADDILAIEALMRRFARRLKRLRTRREAPGRRGARLDLRRTIRCSIGSGGVPLRLSWRRARRVRPRLVLLLDVSRSMSACAFFHLRLARALCAEAADVHCFVFHTRLIDVGEALRDPDPWRAEERLHAIAAGWAGGTRIGECLRELHRAHGRLLHRRTAVVVLSDGYDTGDPGTLSQALAAIARRVRRVAWLNPLLGRPGYVPESRGMREAIPHLDVLAPAGDLASIERALPMVMEALR